MIVRVATRRSAQAMAQSQVIADALRARHPSLVVELVPIDTTGDRRSDVPLHTIGGQGVFVKEVQHAVLDGRADIAVHSAKDLPSSTGVHDDGLVVAAWTERRDPRDALVGRCLADLAHGAVVATGSVRRRAQLAAARPDLTFVELRGNIHTRLERLPTDGALVMAVAALEILGLTDRIAEMLPVDRFTPAPGQGCVAVECRAGDEQIAALLADIDDATTRRHVETERAFLAELGTGCSLPVGAHVHTSVGEPHRDVLYGFLAGPAHVARAEITLPQRDNHGSDRDHDRPDMRAAAALARRLAVEVTGP